MRQHWKNGRPLALSIRACRYERSWPNDGWPVPMKKRVVAELFPEKRRYRLPDLIELPEVRLIQRRMSEQRTIVRVDFQ